MRWLLVVAFVVLAFAPAASAGSTNPCVLVASADAAKVIGGKPVGKATDARPLQGVHLQERPQDDHGALPQDGEGRFREEREEEPAARVPDSGNRRRGVLGRRRLGLARLAEGIGADLHLHRDQPGREDADGSRKRCARSACSDYSYCSASSTLRRAARRAGKIAASRPTMIAAITKITIVRHGTANGTPPIARSKSSASPAPSGNPERGADQRRHDRLVADHPARLPARHPDCAQHADLARALEHRQHERVHDPEQRDDDREPEQDVEEEQEAVQALLLVLDELRFGLDLRVGERRSARL